MSEEVNTLWDAKKPGISVNLDTGRIAIHRTTLEIMRYPEYYRFLLNLRKKQFAIQSCGIDDDGAHRLPEIKAYALYYYLKKGGYDVDLLNYRPFDSRLFKPRKQIKDIFFSVLKQRENRQRIQRYIEFRAKNLCLRGEPISKSEELEALNKTYDAFITGSDQLWNCETEICYDFYLQFVEDSKLRLSYGPSFGQDEIPEKFEKDVARLLKRYNLMSVRESSGSKIVEKLTGKKIPVVCDPTFLLKQEEWLKVAAAPVKECGYIFIYTTQVSQKVIELVKQYLRLHPTHR